jgi:hypothetical protein
MQTYLANSDKYLLQVGQQLRKITSIYKLNISGYKKLWLTGNPDMVKCKWLFTKECSLDGFSYDNPESLMYYTKTFEEYDDYLTKNIVFIDLFDSAANNTVLECIVRNTPIILNRTPGVLEYLGANYPLFFDSLDQVQSLLSVDKLTAAHNYLKNMDKHTFTLDYFARSVATNLNNIS